MKTFSQFCEDASPLEQSQQLRDAEAERRTTFIANNQAKEKKKRLEKIKAKLNAIGFAYDKRDLEDEQ
jgi:hypothetical protein